MRTKIYYFTGTGNSLFIARKLARQFDSTIESIPEAISQMNDEKIGSHIILVFPSYLAMIYGIPVIVKDFIESIPDLSLKTIIAVCSCGGYEIVNAVPSVKFLAKIIKARGGDLFDYYTLRLPMNNLDYDHIPIPIEKDEKKLYENAEEKLKIIVKSLQNPKRFNIKKIAHAIFQILLTPLFSLLKKLSYKSMLEIAKEPEDSQKTIEEVFRLTDRSISADELCNSCGVCVKVCPVGNIQLVEKRPVWLHHCEMCFACHEWCPQKAIHHWGRKEGIYYHHPQVSLNDFI
ncbi:MAG: EFR1 family ferrodoxin [Spirochaetaceae bacterium]|jgi:formate hydrogenlyase subunit 6/NADH:ubiquinone oxidoreductase subunit I/flavodoxin|nr:EFR1 family ferrodoxin [Spirochaetaceae bacterium]